MNQAKNIMNLKYFLYLGLTLIFLNSGCTKENDSPQPQSINLEEEINQIADQYLKVGLVIGIIDDKQIKHTYSYGSKSLGLQEPPDANTAFDIGSMTKTFTVTLIALKYLEGDYEDETVSHYLPADQVTMPNWNGKEIRFIELATHTSGLPRTPHAEGSDFPRPPGFDPDNPYAAYSTSQVYDYLSHYCQLEFEPGTWWGYSNTGYGLLGHIAGLVDGSSYEEVLSREIFKELDMNHSSLFLTDDQLTNCVSGYNAGMEKMPYYTAQDIFQGAGFIKSTLNDLFNYLEANMGLRNTSLREAMDLAHQPQLHQGSMGDQGLAWYILDLDDGQRVIYTGGDTSGQSSYLGFNKSSSTGVIILSNYAMHGDQLAMGAAIMQAIAKY
jgi:CubicO group peptidase (beta-lactamase class C family)